MRNHPILDAPDPIPVYGIDPQNTLVSEDVFNVLLTRDRKEFAHVIVGVAMPPSFESLSKKRVVQAVLQQKYGDRNGQTFLDRGHKIHLGFADGRVQEALVACYSISKSKLPGVIEITERLAIKEVRPTLTTYVEFEQRQDFPEIEENFREFLKNSDNPGVWQKYVYGLGTENWKDPPTPSRLQMRALLEIFTLTCSEFAYRHAISTLSFKGAKELVFSAKNKEAKFTNPYRNVRAMINLSNLIAVMKGEPPPFTREFFEEIRDNLLSKQK